jgi:glycosyltransferase involved in cell wall biosynthesis
LRAHRHESGADADAPARLVLDLTDTINHLAAGKPMGGVVRTVVQIVRQIVGLEDELRERVSFVFHHPVSGRYCAIEPAIFDGAVLEDRDALLQALDLVGVPIAFTDHRPDTALQRLQRRIKVPMRVRRAMAPLQGTRQAGWALKPWHLPQQGTVRVTALGAGWTVPDQLERHARLASAGHVEIVPVVYDLIPILGAEIADERFERWFAELAALATRYVTISRFSAGDIAAAVPRLGGRIDWVRPVPLAHEFDWAGAGDPAHVPPGDYVLSVGSLDHTHKNLDRLLAVWAALHRELGPDRLPKLVLAGAHGRSAERRDAFLACHPALAGHIVLVDRPGDAVLAALYQGCLFSVYPSLYEGWGLPVGESAWFGRLCLASNVTSVPEVLGEAADYFDPTSLDDMIATIVRPIRDRAYLASREEALRAVPLRRWSDVARDLVTELTA